MSTHQILIVLYVWAAVLVVWFAGLIWWVVWLIRERAAFKRTAALRAERLRKGGRQ